MSQEQEAAFAEEAQEEAIIAQTQSYYQDGTSSGKKQDIRTEITEAVDSSSETSPLIGIESDARRRRLYKRAGASYERAINEPWTGGYGRQNLPWYKRPSPYWLLPAFLPFCIAFGGTMVPRAYLIQDLLCREYFSDQARKNPTSHSMPILVGHGDKQCELPEVSALFTVFTTYINTITGVLSALVAPYFGALSDRHGRKKVIVLCSMGALAGEVIMIVIGNFPDQVSVYWILLGSFCDGIAGSFTTALALAFAFCSDSSSPEQRGVAFGRFHGALFAGMSIGPIVAGAMIKATNNILVPFYFALGCHFFFMSFVAFVVPETLSQERQELAREKHAKAKAEVSDQSWMQTIRRFNPFEPLWILRPKGVGTSPALRRNLLFLASIDTMMFGVAMGTMNILITYLRLRFHWDPVDSSVFMSTVNIVRVSGLLLLLPLLTRLFRGRNQVSGHRGSDRLDLGIIRFSILFDLVGYLGYALAPTAGITYMSAIFAAVGGIGSPTLSSSLTKHVPAQMTGQILGALGLLHALARVVAPIIFNIIYSITVGVFPGLVFLCLASVFVIVFALSLFLKPDLFLQDQSSMEQDTQQTGTAEVTN